MKKEEMKKEEMNEYQKAQLPERKEDSTKVNFKNEVFEIKALEEHNYYYSLKYKGKLVDKYGSYNRDGISFHAINCKAEQFMDFDGKYIPENVDFSYSYPENKKGENPFLVHISRKENTVSLDFFISIGDDDFFEMDINPVKQLALFFDLVKKAGYEIDYDKEMRDSSYCCNILITFPANGNLYKTYKKHIDVFADLLKKAADKMGNKKLSLS